MSGNPPSPQRHNTVYVSRDWVRALEQAGPDEIINVEDYRIDNGPEVGSSGQTYGEYMRAREAEQQEQAEKRRAAGLSFNPLR